MTGLTATHGLSDEVLEQIIRDYLTTHPDDTSKQVAQGLRAAGHTGFQSFQVHDVCERFHPIPTLTTVEEATDLLATLAESYEWVSVFYDRGWGDSSLEITVIVDGDGQMPIARLTPDVYIRLLAQQVIRPNGLTTFKARKLHDYVNAEADA